MPRYGLSSIAVDFNEVIVIAFREFVSFGVVVTVDHLYAAVFEWISDDGGHRSGNERSLRFDSDKRFFVDRCQAFRQDEVRFGDVQGLERDIVQKGGIIFGPGIRPSVNRQVG